MTPKERLAKELTKILESIGHSVYPNRIHPVSGYWKKQDVYRWEAFTTPSGDVISKAINSWDTITDCLKYGFEIDFEDGEFIVSSGKSLTPFGENPKKIQSRLKEKFTGRLRKSYKEY